MSTIINRSTKFYGFLKNIFTLSWTLEFTRIEGMIEDFELFAQLVI